MFEGNTKCFIIKANTKFFFEGESPTLSIYMYVYV